MKIAVSLRKLLFSAIKRKLYIRKAEVCAIPPARLRAKPQFVVGAVEYGTLYYAPTSPPVVSLPNLYHAPTNVKSSMESFRTALILVLLMSNSF